jgi:hypothetical protein
LLPVISKKGLTHLQAKIDVNDYDESQLIEIRVALDMPYQNSSSDLKDTTVKLKSMAKFMRT